MNVRIKVFDPILFLLAFLATGLGLVAIFDAGYARSLSESHGWVPPEFRSQLMWLPMALLFFFGCSAISPRSWKKIATWGWIVNLALLVAVELHGTEQNGAKRWIGVGKFGIEPSEFAKIAVILYLASVFADRARWPKKIVPRKHWAQTVESIWLPKLKRAWPAVFVGIGVALIDKQPDMGTAAVIAATAFLMFFPAGVTAKSILAAMLISGALLGILVIRQPYRIDRITHHAQRWLPENVDETEFQTAQSELAQADGGLLGVGPGGGRAKHILPATTTDFIFATIGEETGLVGSLVVMAVLGGVVWRILYLSSKATDRFSMLVLFGIGSWLGIQTCVNVMMANAFLPAIGIPLPFISSGGSSLIALWMAVGICQATQMPAPRSKEEGEKVANRSNRWWHRRSHLSRA